MENYILEVCVDSVASAIAATNGGANRLEVCANLVIGGTTPSLSLLQTIKRYCNLKCHVLIRPRFGDFCYSNYEFEMMLEDVKMFKDAGASGVVLGILQPDGNLDVRRMKQLIEAADSMSITLHRAFDMCKDPFRTLEEAQQLGINTILTSGQKQNCIEGKALLRQLVEKSNGSIEILAGSGINANIIPSLRESTNIFAYHMSGKKIMNSPMDYRKQDVSMGLPFLNEYEIWQTDEAMIKEAHDILEKI